jgi:hypothetical protein
VIRASILRRYLACAPGARPHIPVDRLAPLKDFEQVAAQIPIFRAMRVGDQETSADRTTEGTQLAGEPPFLTVVVNRPPMQTSKEHIG